MPQMNPPAVSPPHCHGTHSRHFQRTDITALVSSRAEVDTQAPGRGWAVSPPRAVGCRHRGPRPGQRMAQEAFEAYGKSSPLHELPHLLFPPGYVRPPVSMRTGGSRHGTLNTWQRRGDYCQGAAVAGETGVYCRNPREGHHRATRAGNVHVLCAPPSPHCPHPQTRDRSEPHCHAQCVPATDRAAGWGGSKEKKRYNRAVARRVLAQCLPPTEGTCLFPEAGTRGTKGAEESHTANTPHQTGRKRETEAHGSKRQHRGAESPEAWPHALQSPQRRGETQ